MEKRTKIYLVFILALISINFICAQPPIIQTTSLTSGYEISIPQIGTWVEGRNYEFNIHVTNISNGYPIDNSSTNCYLHFYNTSGNNLFALEMTFSSVNEWYLNIAGQNLSSPEVGGKVQCYSSTDMLGGIKDFAYYITPSGISLEIPEAILYIVLILINLLTFIFFMYFAITIPFTNKENEVGDIIKILKIKYLKLAAIWFSYASFLWFFTMFTGIMNNFISLDIYKNMISTLYIVFTGIGLGLTILLLIFTFVKVWKDILLNDEIKKWGKAVVNKK